MRLVRLVNELEKLLAAENPQIKLENESINPEDILLRLCDSFSISFQQKGVHLEVKSTKLADGFYGDRDRVIQILTNIINNALKYTPEGKTVTLSVIEDDHMVGFSVGDEGLGISEEDIPLVFERFYRGDKSRDRKTGGIGIGLSIVKALVDAHNGKILIESTIGKGTKIDILFPKETV